MATDEKYLDNLLQTIIDNEKKPQTLPDGPIGTEEQAGSQEQAGPQEQVRAQEQAGPQEQAGYAELQEYTGSQEHTATKESIKTDKNTVASASGKEETAITPETLADMVDRLDEILLRQASIPSTDDISSINDNDEKVLSQQDLDSLFEEMDAQLGLSDTDGEDSSKLISYAGQDVIETSEHMADEDQESAEAARLISELEQNGLEVSKSSDEAIYSNEAEMPITESDKIMEEQAQVSKPDDVYAEIPEESSDLLADLLAELPEEPIVPEDTMQPAGEGELSELSNYDLEMTPSDMNDMEISDLLDGMGDDEDLSEIKGLLDKAENNELVDDDMMALLDGSVEYGDKNASEDNDDLLALFNNEDTEEASGKVKKKGKRKLRKGKKRSGQEQEGQEQEGQEVPAEFSAIEFDELIPEKNAPKGFFKRLFALLIDADEENEPIGTVGEMSMISDENQGILAELAREDKKAEKSRKAKKDKKKGKDTKSISEADEIPDKSSRAGREEAEEPKDTGKKKPKKEKTKKQKEPEIPLKKEKKVSRKKVLLVFAFSLTLLAAIIAACRFIPDYMERVKARSAYMNDDYKAVYDLLYGKSLSRGDTILFNQSYVILQMERSLDSYHNYTSMGMPADALHALFQGAARYEELKAGDLYDVQDRVDEIHQEIQGLLSSQYNVSSDEVLTILSYDDAAYSHQVYILALGIDYWASAETDETAASDETTTSDETAASEELQDLLPEEEDFMQ